MSDALAWLVAKGLIPKTVLGDIRPRRVEDKDTVDLLVEAERKSANTAPRAKGRSVAASPTE